MSKGEFVMSKEKLVIINGVGKGCFDCLYCKVSAKSTENSRLCFCAKTKTRATHKEHYWLAKHICNKFVDMTEPPLTVLIIKADVVLPLNKRKPLLRNTV